MVASPDCSLLTRTCISSPPLGAAATLPDNAGEDPEEELTAVLHAIQPVI
jgi:hypothetical protein